MLCSTRTTLSGANIWTMFGWADVLVFVGLLGLLWSILHLGRIAWFQGTLLRVECASIYADFTAQVWNMTFGFYRSLVTISSDMREAASAYGLNRIKSMASVYNSGVTVINS